MSAEDINQEDQKKLNKKKGDALEGAIEHILKIGGLKTDRNIFLNTYEIDVVATIGDRTIIFECKNYQNSSLNIRNLIHQWYGKNQIIRAHKIVLVIAGVAIGEKDRELASNFDMEIWGDEDLTDLFQLSLEPELLRERLFKKISLTPITISDRYREDIIFFIIKKILVGSPIANEINYELLNKWLRAYIITQLQMQKTTKSERQKHIELFEGTKTKKGGGFLRFKSTRTESEYWKSVANQLGNNKIFSEEKQNEYLSYMEDLMDEYKSQLSFLINKSGNEDDRIKAILSARLYQAAINGEECLFRFSSTPGIIQIIPWDEGNFQIKVLEVNKAQRNILNWILTSEYIQHYNDFSWFCSTIDETTEKIYRICTEYFNIKHIDLRDNILMKARMTE